MSKIAFFIVSILIMSTNSFAQLATVKGVVNDEFNETLPGVNVLIKGTSAGSTTNIDGEYSISTELNDSSVLVFSYVGYKVQEVLIAGRSILNIQLDPSSKSLIKSKMFPILTISLE